MTRFGQPSPNDVLPQASLKALRKSAEQRTGGGRVEVLVNASDEPVVVEADNGTHVRRRRETIRTGQRHDVLFGHDMVGNRTDVCR